MTRPRRRPVPERHPQIPSAAQLVHVGCSGWQYQHWRGDFYPAGLPQTHWLESYAERFDTVEINNSFYRLPESITFRTWRDRVPPGFIYAVKASRYLTHMKKLKDPRDPLRLFFSRSRNLGPTLGPVLYQLPPRWPVNVERLRVFLQTLPKRRLHVMKFREPSWSTEEVFAGDYIELRAEMDLIIGLTACSAEMSNNYRFKPIDFVIVD